MIGTFAEAVRATLQPCTFLLLVPALAAVLVAGSAWSSLAAAAVGAVLGGWLVAANWWVLTGVALQISAALAFAAFVAFLAAWYVPRLAGLRRPGVLAAFTGATTLLATQWWRPCVGEELGAILTESQTALIGQLPGMTAYMLGAMLPVVAIVLLLRSVDPVCLQFAAIPAAVVGAGVAAALVGGRHDEVVVALTRWTT